MSEEIARAALAASGIADDQLVPRHGWANEAWLGSHHVVRISSGRLTGSLSHEAAVIATLRDGGVDVPVAAPVAHGLAADLVAGAHHDAEWLISERRRGDTLANGWGTMDSDARRRVGRTLGDLLRTLHASTVDVPAPRWWSDAHENPDLIHNAYRPRVELGPSLVEAARAVATSTDDASLLDDCAALLAERQPLFDWDDAVPIHTDVHAHNILVDGAEITALLDWEGAHRASADQELDMFLRYVAAAHHFPERPGVEAAVTEGDMLPLIDHVGHAYPELFASPHLIERLEVYDVHWHLGSILVTDRMGPPGRDPAWDRLRATVDGRSHVRGLLG